MTFGGSRPSTTTRMFFDLRLDQRLCREHMLHLRRADAEGERAERAVGRGVAVAAHQRDARQREALLRADDVADALALVELVVIFEAEQPGVLGQIGDLRGAFGIPGWAWCGPTSARCGRPPAASSRRAHLEAGTPQPRECLRAVHLVDDMPVDIEQAGAVRLLVDHVIAPDHVVEGTGRVHALIHRRQPPHGELDPPVGSSRQLSISVM